MVASRPTRTGRTGRCSSMASTLPCMTCAATDGTRPASCGSTTSRHWWTTIAASSMRWARPSGAKPTVGVFHSLTTVVALMHEQQWPTFAALVLFDAPIYPPGADLGDMEAVNQRHAKRARGRRRWYESSRELAAALARSPFFARVSPEVCALFAETTLRPVAGGGYELRCPPEYEAQLAQWYFGFSIQAPEALETIDIPIKVVGGRSLCAVDVPAQHGFEHTHISGLRLHSRCDSPSATRGPARLCRHDHPVPETPRALSLDWWPR